MNCFSGAAFRFGHTMLSSQLVRVDSNLLPIANGHLPLMDAFFPRTELIDTVTCRVLDQLGIENELMRRWTGLRPRHQNMETL